MVLRSEFDVAFLNAYNHVLYNRTDFELDFHEMYNDSFFFYNFWT